MVRGGGPQRKGRRGGAGDDGGDDGDNNAGGDDDDDDDNNDGAGGRNDDDGDDGDNNGGGDDGGDSNDDNDDNNGGGDGGGDNNGGAGSNDDDDNNGGGDDGGDSNDDNDDNNGGGDDGGGSNDDDDNNGGGDGAGGGGVGMTQVVLIRHGESQWNRENRFTGWVDVPLSPHGEQEAREAGEKLRTFRFDRAFASVLTRAVRTLDIVLEVIGQSHIPVEQDRALNERMYGDLQGRNKAETVAQYGEAQVTLWRRSYDVRPPGGESLRDTAERVIPYYQRHIQPRLADGETLLVVAHGNSLRALVMHLTALSRDDVLELNIPTGAPLVYDFDARGRVEAHRYL